MIGRIQYSLSQLPKVQAKLRIIPRLRQNPIDNTGQGLN